MKDIGCPPAARSIESIAFDPQGTPYIGAGNVYRFVNGRWEPVLPADRVSDVRAMVIGSTQMWLATNTGLMVIDRSSGKELLHVGSELMWELQENEEFVVVASSTNVWRITKSDMGVTLLPSIAVHRRPGLHKVGSQIVVSGMSSWTVTRNGYVPSFHLPATRCADGEYTVTASDIFGPGIHVAHNLDSLIPHTCVQWANSLVIGTLSGGLYRLGSNGVNAVPITDGAVEVWSLAAGPGDELWVGTDLGVYVLLNETRVQRLGLKSWRVEQLEPLTLIDPKNGYLDGKNVGTALAFCVDSQGTHWGSILQAVTRNGADYVEGVGFHKIEELEPGRLGLWSVKGISILDEASRSVQLVDTFSAIGAAGTIRTSSGDFLTVADDGSVYRLSKSGVAVGKAFNARPGSYPLCEIAGNIYACKNGAFNSLTKPGAKLEGLDAYTGAVSSAYDGREWWTLGSTEQGPRVYHSKDGRQWAPVMLPRITGIGDPAEMTIREGWLAIPGSKDTMRFNLAKIADANPPLSVQPEVKLNTRQTSDVGPWERINSVAIEWTQPRADDFEPVTLEWRILPADDRWHPALSETRATFPGLRSGKYEFQLRANQYGLKGPVAHAAFVIRPVWYGTPAAWTIYGSMALLGLLSVQRWRTRRLLDRQRELEAEILNRTAELRRANEVKSDFLANINHEIRNPMNGIIGITRMMRDGALEPRNVFLLNTLSACCEQLYSTLGDALDFTAIDRGHLELSTDNFDVFALVRSSCASYDVSGTQIFACVPASSRWVRGDSGKIRQILGNLLSNALKYGVPPGARVVAKMPAFSAGKYTVNIQVRNVGPALSHDELREVFKPFTRGRRARDTGAPGAGLGLSLSRKFAEKMEGKLEVESAHGEVVFTLSLTLDEGEPALPVVTLPLGGRHVLAVEDEKYNRLVLGHYLNRMGVTTTWANNITSALASIRGAKFDLIVTDWFLPDGTGGDLINQLRTDSTNHLPPIIAVSAFSTPEKKVECLAAGASAFISKPITFEALRKTLTDLHLLDSPQGDPGFVARDVEVIDYSRVATLSTIAPSRQDFAGALENSRRDLMAVWQSDRRQAAEIVHKVKGQLLLLGAHACVSQLNALERALGADTSEESLAAIVTQTDFAVSAIVAEVWNTANHRDA